MITRNDFDRLLTPNYKPQAEVLVRGLGSKVWDQKGKEYLDFAGGIAVNGLGHCHPDLVEAISKQSTKLWHVSNLFTNETVLELSKKLTNSTFADKAFFANSGAEANEAALKLARRYANDNFGSEKQRIISFDNSFHGRTFFTVSVGGKKIYSDGFGPKPGGITHLPFNDIAAFEKSIDDDTCAVILELIQGEGGVVPAKTDFLKAIRQLCDKHNALLIFDEVQTGCGRTGYLYNYMSVGVVPDILTTAKALGGGFPISAMLTTDNIAASLVVGTHASTFGGNPLACAVANQVFEIVSDPDLLARVRQMGFYFINELSRLGYLSGYFKDIRGQGLLIGAELSDGISDTSVEFIKYCFESGLLVTAAGPRTLRFCPSLLITEEEISEGIKRLAAAIDSHVAQSADRISPQHRTIECAR